jgi:hypothetical protein
MRRKNTTVILHEVAGSQRMRNIREILPRAGNIAGIEFLI